MQAIARVNRMFAGKEGGLVVDYIGIAAELKTYTDAKDKGTPTLKAVRLDRRARPLFRPNGRCIWNADEKMKSSLRREKVKWARRGGHALPELGVGARRSGNGLRRDATATRRRMWRIRCVRRWTARRNSRRSWRFYRRSARCCGSTTRSGGLRSAVSMKCQCWAVNRFLLTRHGLRRFGDRRSLIESSQVIEEMIQMAKDMQEAIGLVLAQAQALADDWSAR